MIVGSSVAVPIRENVVSVHDRIARACARSGRTRGEVTLVAVSKTFPAGFVDEAIDAGITEVGENRVQEAREKKPLVRGTARWHLIGHLQTNKARDAVKLFDVIQAVGSLDLAGKLARAARPRASVDGDERRFRGSDRGRIDLRTRWPRDLREPRLDGNH